MTEPRSIYELGNAGIAILEAEILRMKPVIDAAVAWRLSTIAGAPAEVYVIATAELAGAIDAYAVNQEATK